ncbi:unnamed protein product [Clonostachys byssicola]|uniref:Uncharacterized protein n=1 Tax=Clonostachys byssicola TaxID=160290 RepID=A0A9N9UXW0_9HYPO|nr:unnamed protein product [Clonostachys byssicola]
MILRQQYETVRKSGQYSRRFGSHGYIIESNVNLGDTLQKIGDLDEHDNQTHYATPSRVQYLHVYCDVLEVALEEDGSVQIRAPHKLRWLRIFARKLSFPAARVPESESSPSNVERVTAFWNISDRAFKLFGFEMKRLATTLGHDYIAATGAFPAKITEITDLSPTEFDLRRPEVEMMDNLGTIDRLTYKNNELAIFVKNQLQLAITSMNSGAPSPSSERSIIEVLHSPEITSRLEFITLITKGYVMMADVRKVASTLLYRLRVPDAARVWVPKSSFSSLHSSLTQWEDYARAIEDACDTQKILNNGADKVLEKMTLFQLQDAKLDRKNFGNRYKEAADALSSLAKDFDTFKVGFLIEKGKFEQSVEKWKQEQYDKMVLDIVFAGIEIAAAIGITVFTLGATAGGVVAGAGELANTVEHISQTAEKTEKALSEFEKLKLIFERIGQMREWTEKAKEYYNKVNEALNSDPKHPSDGLAKAQLVPPTDLEAINFYELLNQWDDFERENNAMFKEMAGVDPPIDGLSQFQMAMEKMTNRARHMIQAQKELQSIDNQLRLAVDHEQLREQRRDMFAKAADPADDRFLQYQMDQSMRTTRLQIFLLLHETFCAYVFETNTQYFPAGLVFRDNETVSKLSEAKALMYQAHKNYLGRGAMDTIIPLRFRTSTGPGMAINNSIFPQSWKKLLESQGQVPFSIPIGHPKCLKKCLARIKSAMLYFEGITPRVPGSTQPNGGLNKEDLEDLVVPLVIEFGPLMTQLEHDGTETQYFGSLMQVESDQPFVFQTSGRVFQTFPKSSMSPALYTSGQVKLRAMGWEEWDLSTVTEIIMEIHVQSHGDA